MSMQVSRVQEQLCTSLKALSTHAPVLTLTNRFLELRGEGKVKGGIKGGEGEREGKIISRVNEKRKNSFEDLLIGNPND
jgi:hypothetical protein